MKTNRLRDNAAFARERLGGTLALKLTVIGCSPAWPNPGSAQSGYLVEVQQQRLLLDCGPGVLARLRERSNGWPQVEAIAITHFHLDHWGDLVPWAWGALYGPGRGAPRPELWVPPGGAETLRFFGRQLGFVDMFDNVFSVREYADARVFRAAGLDVVPIRLPHYELHTFGLRVSTGTKSLAYSSDSAPARQLAELARDADLFLCEATLAREEPDLRGHLTADECVAAFRESGARRLVVIHRPNEHSLDPQLERAYDGWEAEI
jgi:ribonuclease BN (tRNA processing enzyme)